MKYKKISLISVFYILSLTGTLLINFTYRNKYQSYPYVISIHFNESIYRHIVDTHNGKYRIEHLIEEMGSFTGVTEYSYSYSMSYESDRFASQRSNTKYILLGAYKSFPSEEFNVITGSWFTNEEIEDGIPVCLINDVLAKADNIKIGDSVSIYTPILIDNKPNSKPIIRTLELKVIGTYSDEFTHLSRNTRIIVPNNVILQNYQENKAYRNAVNGVMFTDFGISDPIFYLDHYSNFDKFTKELNALIPDETYDLDSNFPEFLLDSINNTKMVILFSNYGIIFSTIFLTVLLVFKMKKTSHAT